MFLLLTLFACTDKVSDTADTGTDTDTTDTTDITVGDQSLSVTATDYGTLHATWICTSGGTLTFTSASGDQQILEAATDPCLRELEISAPPGTAVTFELTGDGSSTHEETTPALPDGIYELGAGMTLEGDWPEEGITLLGYDFVGELDEPGWGIGAVVLLDASGRHLAHVLGPVADHLSHKSAALTDGELVVINYKKDFDEPSMATNTVSVVALGGLPMASQRREVPVPQGHHFLDLTDEGELLYLDIGRVCDFEGSGQTLAHDRLLTLPIDGGEPELLFDTLDEWIDLVIAREGLTETLDAAMGSYTNYDCGAGTPQRVRDVAHANGADCVGDTCLISAIGSIETLLLVDRTTGALRHDLETFDTSWADGFGTHHDAQFIGDDRILIFENGVPETGATPVLYEYDADAGTVSELWAPRRTEDCIQASAMGWVTGVDGEDIKGTLAAWTPGGAPPDVRALLSYGTGGIFTLEDGAGARLGRITFDANDGSTNDCGGSARADIASGQIQHLSEATLAAEFPDWIRLR